LSFKVIEGGDLDINFVVNGPGHAALVMDASSSDGLHAIDIKTTGEHEICLDNSFSRFTGNILKAFSVLSPAILHHLLYIHWCMCEVLQYS